MELIGRDQFRAAMARFPGAVTVVTARTVEGDRRGITATAVCSVTADPPSVLVCLNKATGTCATVKTTGSFAVNLLSEAQGELALRFAGQGGVSGEEKFADGDWLISDSGLPILQDASVALCCEVGESVEVGTHCVFIGRIVDLMHGQGNALIYERSSFQRLSPLSA